MSSGGDTYDPRYLEGIRHFNASEFFEAHNVWEDLWRECTGSKRRFYQGLIQVAVCLHHFRNGNTVGAKKLFSTCQGYLAGYRPRYLGLDLEKLLAELRVCCAEILASDEKCPRVEIVVDRIPRIHLDISIVASENDRRR